MPLILPSNSISAVGYDVANSLRFNDGSSDYLIRTPSSASNRKTFTFSTWVKRITSGSDYIFAVKTGTGASDNFYFGWRNDQIQISSQSADGSTTNINIRSNALYRDFSAWYHLVCAVDTTQGTSTNRLKLYVNGSQVTSLENTTYPNENDDIYGINNTIEHSFGRENYEGGANYHSYYLAETVLIDGQQLDPTSFGEFDEDTGIWKPIDVSSLTFGTNGFYLPFENSGALGQDDSGNGNNFTVNNLTSIDQTTDTPTNNYATFNPLINNWTSISQGNLKVTNTIQAYRDVFSTIAVTSGKWYVECRIDTEIGGTYPIFGIADASEYQYPAQYNLLGRSPLGWGFQTDGNYYNNNADAGNWSTLDSGDIIGFYLDLDSAQNTLKVYKNGVSELSINISNPVDGYYFGCSTFGEDSVSGSINFGNPIYTLTSANSDANGYGSFEYSPTISSVNYYALNTKNLSEFG